MLTTLLRLTILILTLALGWRMLTHTPPHPTHLNANQHLYRDQSGVCYRYHLLKLTTAEAAAPDKPQHSAAS
jgi:hypothetical protein